MTSIEFIGILAETYNEPLSRDNGSPNLKLKFIKSWLDANIKPEELEQMAEKVIKGFIPTSTNPCPLIPHIIEICEIQTTEKSKMELARTVADRIIYAVLNFGCMELGSRAKSYAHIGKLGIDVLNNSYGAWHKACEVMQSESIEVVRSHLRDSVYAYINRKERGIEDQPPAIEDLVAERKDIKSMIKELAEQKAIE